ncbi:MAG: response regulator [Dehalococcoidia bacterium]|nr:response regulator [Dehalococcoidia bacterium]
MGERGKAQNAVRSGSRRLLHPVGEDTSGLKAAQKFSLLIVDDDVDLALNLQDIFLTEGYDVAAAFRAQAALALCGKRAFNLALVDIELPDMSGLRLVERTEESCPKTECIVITGHVALDSAIAAVGHRRIISYETKPLDLARLTSLVRQVKERQQAEEALRQTETRLGVVLGQIPCILWATDAGLNTTSLAGVGADFVDKHLKLGGRRRASAAPPRDGKASPLLAAHRSALSGSAQSCELKWRGKDLYCHVEPLRDAAGVVAGVVGIATDISEQKRREAELQALSRRLAEVQERERGQLARDLHDEFAQTLTALKMSLDRAAVGVEGNTGKVLRDSSALVGELMAWVREFSLDLRPTMLDDLGLAEALLWYAGRFSTKTGVRVSLKYSGLPRNLPSEVGTAAYRIVQEALTNVARHAHAEEAIVRLWADEVSMTIQIEDRGTGFDAALLSIDKSIGISGMRERALGLGGTFRLDAAPGRGARISVELPLPNHPEVGRHRRKH